MGSIIRLSPSAPPRKTTAKPDGTSTVDPNSVLVAGGNWPFIQGTARARAVKIAAVDSGSSGTTTTTTIGNPAIFDGGSGPNYREDPGGEYGQYDAGIWNYSAHRDAFYEDPKGGADYVYVPREITTTETTAPGEVNSALYGVCIPIVPDSDAEIYAILAGGWLIADFASSSPFTYDGISDYAINSGKLTQAVPAVLANVAIPTATTGDGSQSGDQPTTGGSILPVSGNFSSSAPSEGSTGSTTGHAAYRGRLTFDMTLDASGLPAGDDIEVIFGIIGGDDESGDDQRFEFDPVEPYVNWNPNPQTVGPYFSADAAFAWGFAPRSFEVGNIVDWTAAEQPAITKYNASTGDIVSDTALSVSASVTGKAASNFTAGNASAVIAGVNQYDYIHVPGEDGYLIIWVECYDSPFNDEPCIVDCATGEIIAFLDANIEGGFGRDTCWQKRADGTYFVAWIHADTLKVAIFDPVATTFTLFRDKDWSTELFNAVCQRMDFSHQVHDGTLGKLFLDEYNGAFTQVEIFQYDLENDSRSTVFSTTNKTVMRMWNLERRVYIYWDDDSFTKAWRPGEGSGGETHTALGMSIDFSSVFHVNGGVTQSILVVESASSASILLKGDTAHIFYLLNFGTSTPIITTFDFSGSPNPTPLINNDAAVWYGNVGCALVSRGESTTSPSFDTSEAGPVKVCVDPQFQTSAPFTLGWITEQIGKLVGFTSAQFDREDLSDLLYGATLDEVEFQNYIRDIREVFDFTVDDHDGVFHLTRIPSGASYAPDATLTVADLVRRPDANAGSYVHWERAEETTLPHAVEIEFYDPARLYVRGHVTATLAGVNISPARTRKYTIPFAILERDVIARAYITLHNIWAERLTYEISVRAKNVLLTVGDLIRFPLGDYLVDARIVSSRMDGDEVQNLTLQGVVQDKAILVSANPPSTVIPSPIANQGSQYIDLHIPMLTAVEGNNDTITQYHTVAPSAAFQYAGGRVWRSESGSFIEISVQTDLAFMGTLTAVPTQQSPLLGIDNTNTMTVQMLAGELAQLVTVSQESARAGGNRAAVGKDDRWQIVYFTTPTDIGSGVVEITGIYWGQEGTEVYVDQLQSGDWFVLLNDKTKIPRQIFDAQDITFQDGESVSQRTYKATGLDQHPVAVASVTKRLRGRPEMPYAPWNLAAQEIAGSPGTDILVTWSRRDRVPPSGFAQELPMSETSDGSPEVPEFFVEIIDYTVSPAVLRTATVFEEEYAYQASDVAADFGSPIPTVGSTLTVRVRQVARFRDLAGVFISDAALYGYAAEEGVTIS